MKKRVLYADGDPSDRQTTAKYLKWKEWDITEVFNPEQAIGILKENEDTPFDAVILDVVMPENNPKGGEKVLVFIKKQDASKQRQTPVILLAAWGHNGSAQHAKAVYPGTTIFILTKPFPLEELSTALVIACGAPSKPPVSKSVQKIKCLHY